MLHDANAASGGGAATRRQFLSDPQFGAALGAAPFLWLVLLLFWPQAPDPSWPLRDPGRFLLIALAYPVLEEMVFRGLLQPALFRRAWGQTCYGGLSAANWLTSLLFAASHLAWHSGLQALAVLAPALVFGHFRDRYGRIFPSIVLHVFYNSGFALLFVAAQR